MTQSPNVNILQALERIRELSDITTQSWESWSVKYSADCAEFSAILNKLRNRLAPATEHSLDEADLWRELDQFLKSMHELIRDGAFVVPEASYTEILRDADRRLSAVIENAPSQARIPIAEDFYAAHREDTLLIRCWKSFKRGSASLAKLALSTRNRIRKTFGKTTPPPAIRIRVFPFDDFFRMYAYLPFGLFLLDEWELRLDTARTGIAILHECANSLNAVFLNKLATEEAPPFEADTVRNELLEHIDTYLEQSAACAAALATQRKEAAERALRWVDSVTPEFQRQWRYPGTLMLPAARFNPQRYERFFAKQSKLFERKRKLWAAHFKGEISDWRFNLTLHMAQCHAAISISEAVRSIRAHANSDFHTAFDRAVNVIETALSECATVADSPPIDYYRRVETEQRRLIEQLHETELPAIIDVINAAKLDDIIEGCSREVISQAGELPVEHAVFSVRDAKGIPPKSETDKVPLRALFEKELLVKAQSELTSLQKSLQQNLERIMRSVSEIDAIVEFNIDAALNIIRERKNVIEAHEAVTEGLQRACETLERLAGEFTALQNSALTGLARISTDFLTGVRSLQDNERLLQLKLQATRAHARSIADEFIKRCWSALRYALPKAKSGIAALILAWKNLRARVRSATGIEPPSIQQRRSIRQIITQFRTAKAALPYVYQRMFQTKPISDRRFFVDREKELAQIREDFVAWREGQDAATALVGERGSGCTTLLNFVIREVFQDATVVRIDLVQRIGSEKQLAGIICEACNLPTVDTLADVQELLLGPDVKQVVIVENIQKIFTRTVYGFDILERFLLLVSETHRSCFWTLTCTLYGWRYLDSILALHEIFPRVVTLYDVSRKDIEDIILRRHRVTGYRLSFNASEKTLSNRKYKKLSNEEDRRNYLQQHYFDHLHTLCAGNISIATLLWLQSITDIDQAGIVVDISIIEGSVQIGEISDNDYFTLAAVAQHESLSVAEHALVFREQAQRSAQRLRRLHNNGLLEETEGIFRIQPLVYRAVTKALKMKNILH